MKSLSPPNPTLDDVRRAVALTGFDHMTAWLRMAPRLRAMARPPELTGDARPAGVLVLLYPLDGALAFVLTRRTEKVATHKGQISLPGGAWETTDPDPGATALRETCEELDVCRDDISLVGSLTPLYLSVSDFEVHPYVGFVAEHPAFSPYPTEVAEVIEMPLPALLDDSIKTEEMWTLHGHKMNVPFYRLGEHVIWGATAIMLSEFEGRLRVALGLPES